MGSLSCLSKHKIISGHPNQDYCESPMKVLSSPRPLERNIMNIMVPNNPLKVQKPPPPYEAKTAKILVASIILNPPFIKLTGKADVPKIKNHSSHDNSDILISSPSQSGPVSEDTDSGISLRTNRKTTSYFQVGESDLKATPERSQRPRPRPKSRKVRAGSKFQPRASRTSSRIYQKVKEQLAIHAEASKKLAGKPKACRVSRTVELVDQSVEGWRDDKCKLLFLLSLGLSVKPEAPVIGPVIRVTPADPQLVAQVEKRYEAERIRRLEMERAEDENLRMKRLQFELNGPCLANGKQYIPPIEVIDIVSEDEDSCSIGYILPDLPLLEIRSVVHQGDSRKGTPASSNGSRISAGALPHIVKPKLVKRLNTKLFNRVRHMATSTPNSEAKDPSHVRLPPLVSAAFVPERRKSYMYIAPSPPMKFDKPISEVIQRLQSDPSDPFSLKRVRNEETEVIEID